MPSSSPTKALQSPAARLKLSKAPWKPGKPPPANRQNPVIVYLQPPRVILANPKNFRSLVQRLTGKGPYDSPATAQRSGEDSGRSPELLKGNEGCRSFGELSEMEDPLLLRLGMSYS